MFIHDVLSFSGPNRSDKDSSWSYTIPKPYFVLFEPLQSVYVLLDYDHSTGEWRWTWNAFKVENIVVSLEGLSYEYPYLFNFGNYPSIPIVSCFFCIPMIPLIAFVDITIRIFLKLLIGFYSLVSLCFCFHFHIHGFTIHSYLFNLTLSSMTFTNLEGGELGKFSTGTPRNTSYFHHLPMSV